MNWLLSATTTATTHKRHVLLVFVLTSHNWRLQNVCPINPFSAHFQLIGCIWNEHIQVRQSRVNVTIVAVSLHRLHKNTRFFCFSIILLIERGYFQRHFKRFGRSSSLPFWPCVRAMHTHSHIILKQRGRVQLNII